MRRKTKGSPDILPGPSPKSVPEKFGGIKMKSRYLVILAASLIVPAAFAQQSDKQSAPASQQVAPATQQTTQTQTAPDTSGPNTNNDANLSAHQPLQPDTHEGFWGHLNPFARK